MKGLHPERARVQASTGHLEESEMLGDIERLVSKTGCRSAAECDLALEERNGLTLGRAHRLEG